MGSRQFGTMKNFAPLLFCAACATANPVPAPQVDTCNATSWSGLIGQHATALERVLILGMVRIIRPGDMVTRDFRMERINFMIGSNEMITAVNCG